MKHRLLPVLAAALLLCCWSVAAVACEHAKKTSAAAVAASKSCNYDKAAAVTADAKAACKSHATMASYDKAACKSRGAATAVTADASACKAFGASIVTASAGCAGKSAEAAKSAAMDACCAAKSAKASAVTAATRGQKVDAVLAGSSCQAGAKLTKGNHECDACAELAVCDEELRRIGIDTQVVPLKNGIMIVYTATKKGKAHAVQNAMSRRNDRLHTVTASGDKAKLCSECKTMRGAMASGMLTRETVNIGGGVLTVMTSSDPAMVAKLQGLAATTKT